MTQKKSFPGSGKFDKINSTYKHMIHLQPGNKVEYLPGYSKGLLYKEMADKIVLLESVIVRLVANGYLNASKSIKIDFYLKSFLDNNDELLLTLYPTSYEIYHDKLILSERLTAFFNRLYSQLKSGKIITKDLIDKPMIRTEEDIFSLKKKSFDTVEELRYFCIRKINEGFPIGLVKSFFYQYKTQFL